MTRRIVLGVLALLLWALSACGVPVRTYDSVDEAAYAGAICTDGGWTRVPDDYCPIGDEPVAGSPYSWRYRPYRDTDHDIDVVYVGYPVDRTVWIDQRPARVSTLHIDRGSFPSNPPVGTPAASAAKVETAPQRTREQQDAAKGIQRAGLGDKGVVRSATPEPVKVQVVRKAPPPPPAGQRAIAQAKKKSGKK